ncbi:hypothetical protein U729_3219 (plasmid) [Clostridium baratii str. Sullivan]|uniref:Uncharacterized protein n=1 Tax=Clostridium baratii str. Sullivan TaxID=1415775 RepID=A0A0A7G2Y4_9CLOT|nr:hypothetical protein [Clostridium baratii]AIY85375.1 hypothetical protein U729_3219 [Clostridium baratii str. Sullivan]
MNNVIGSKELQNDGEYLYTRGYSAQGKVYKDYNEFNKKSKEVCYIPELSDYKYNYHDFFNIALGNKRLAKELFDVVDWQSPETYLDELINNGNVKIVDDKAYFNINGDDVDDWKPSKEFL